MLQDQYVVLRSPRGSGLGDPFSGPSFTRGVGMAGTGTDITIDVEPLEKRDIADLRRDPEVESIAPSIPVRLIEPLGVSSDIDIEAADVSTWGVEVTKVDQSPFTGNGVTVAILDTGIDDDHTSFSDVELVQRDFTGEGNGDGNGHGTHVAGTVFGRVVAGIRYSMAPGASRALIGKVLNSEGSGSTDMIFQAILWAVESGAQVVNMSLGFDFPGLVDNLSSQGVPTDLATSWALESYRANVRLFDRLVGLVAARAEFGRGSLIIAAAGNESRRQIDPAYELTVAPPAVADGILAVGALQTAGAPHDALTVADFSNTGPNVSAPGVDIISASPGGGFRSLSGTSMATPHVVGVAALWVEKMVSEVGFYSPNRLSANLISRATDDPIAEGYDPLDVGSGLVQAPLE